MFKKLKESLLLAQVKRRLADNCEQQRLMALEQALTLGQQGFDLFTQLALQDKSEKIRQSAYWILHQDNPYLCKNNQVKSSYKQIFPTDTIACVAISPDNQILVGGSWRKIWVWNLETGELLRTIDAHSHWVLSVAISPDGNTLVSGSADTIIKLWSLNVGLLIRQINAHANWVNAVEITPDGKTIVSASADKTIKIWDFNTGKLQRTLKNHSGSVLSLAISPDGKVIASGSTDKTVKLWNLKSGELYRSLGEHLNWVQAVRISQDSRFLISGSRDGDIKFWQADSDIENQSKSPNSDDIALIAKIIGFVFLIVISKFTAEKVFWIGVLFLSLVDLVGKKNKGAFILNISKLKCSHSIHQESSDTVNNLVISHNGKNLISVSDHNTTKQWCIQTKQLVCTFAGDSGFVSSAAISPDGKILATASNDWIKLWNLHTGQSLHPLKGCAESRLSDISIFSDGRLQPSCQEQEITVPASVGDINTSTVINVIEPARLTTLVIFPQEVELKPGEHQQFSLQNLDQRGNAIATEKIVWRATGGTIDQDGTFLVNQNAKGAFSIWACAIEQNITAIAKVTIPVVFQRLEIFPKKIELEPNEIQTFTAKGFDQEGYEISKRIVNWQCTTGGLIDDHGLFIGNYDTEIVDIIATVGNVSDVACVRLLPVLKSLEIEPQGTQLKPNEQINLRVRGFDQFRNEVKIQNIHWQTTEGKIYPDGTFVAVDRDANITVSATVGNIEGTAHFKVIEPSKLTELVIYPQQVVMNPGQYQDFEVIGLDQRGDAPILVSVPPVLRRLEIFPPQIQLEPEETQTFTVIGFDQYGDQIDPGAIFWEATGGEIDLNGTFIADFNAKGQFLVAATSRSTPNLTKKSKRLLFNVSISIRLLSYVLRLLAQVQNEFITESNTEETSEVSTTVTEIDNFELELQAWITKTIIKLASRFLVVISKLCLNQATDNLTASAEVIVLPVLRHLEVSPAKVQLKPYETINFTVKGLDQHCDEIDVNNVSWKATDGNINSHGILSVDDKYSNVTITATVGTISNFAHGTVVKAPQLISPIFTCYQYEGDKNNVQEERNLGHTNSKNQDINKGIANEDKVTDTSDNANSVSVTSPFLLSNIPNSSDTENQRIDGEHELVDTNGNGNSVSFNTSKSIKISDIYDDKQILKISEALLEASPNRYRLVILVARRAKQIFKNYVEEDMTLKKAVIQAIQEMSLELSQL